MTHWFESFWQKHPALIYGTSALLGVNFVFGNPLNTSLFTLIFFLLLFFKAPSLRKESLIALLMLGLFGTYSHNLYLLPSVPETCLKGNATVEITEIKVSEIYAKKWLYKINIKEFRDTSGTLIGKNIPASLLLPFKKERPSAKAIYTISGTLKKTLHNQYRLSVNQTTQWVQNRRSFNLTEWRYQAKNTLQNYLKSKIKHPKSALFLTGIATGNFDDLMMTHTFSRFGLLHLMAISGFHFAIIAALFSLFLNLLFSQRNTSVILILSMTCYFLFLGSTPSILRAWIMILILLMGQLFQKEAVSLNSLGIAIFLILIYDPLMSQQLGFQFSCITTAFILLFASPIELLLQVIFPKRSLATVVTMRLSDRQMFCLLASARQMLSLSIAVNLSAIPMSLFAFQSFPLLSLIYNLFFPTLVGLSIFLLILSLFTSILFSPFTDTLFFLSSVFTNMTLNLIYNVPLNFDFTLQTTSCSSLLVTLYFTLVSLGGVFLQHRLHEKKLQQKDLLFI